MKRQKNETDYDMYVRYVLGGSPNEYMIIIGLMCLFFAVIGIVGIVVTVGV